MKEETRYFVEEYRQEQEWKERWKANHIEFDNYFKYSGKTEELTKEMEEYFKYEKMHNDIVIDFKKIEKYEKIIKEERAENYQKYIKPKRKWIEKKK